MLVEQTLRLMAGLFVTASILLGLYVHPGFFWFSLFVGLNLLQSGLTNWCIMKTVLTKAGLRPCA